MLVVGFSRKGFLYLQHKTYSWVTAVQVNHSESHMLNTFSSLPEFDTLDEAKDFIVEPIEGDYIPDPNPEC